jgi:hypothetical protein
MIQNTRMQSNRTRIYYFDDPADRENSIILCVLQLCPAIATCVLKAQTDQFYRYHAMKLAKSLRMNVFTLKIK